MKRPFFYGWWNVLCAFVGFAFSHATIAVFCFGTFVTPLQAEFGWNRGEIAFALTVNNLTVMLVAPLLGFMIDKAGVRRILLPSLILMSIAIASMALLSANIWHFYVMYFLIPFFGMATLPHAYSRVIIAWFSRNRGLALGIALAGIGAGAALAPIITQALIASSGWRFAYAGYAMLVLIISLPLSYFLLRDKPAEMGQSVDGDDINSSTDVQDIESMEHEKSGLTLVASIKTTTFWLILVSIFLAGLVMVSMFVHMVPMFIDRGLSPSTAAYGAGALGGALIIGRIVSGYLMDRYFAPYIAAVFLIGLAIAMLILATGAAGTAVFIAAILIGLASGSEMSEVAYIVSRYFGYRAFGKIYGLMLSAFQLGGAIGAPVLGLYQHKTGDYTGMLWVLVGASIGAAVLIAMLGKYPEMIQK